MDELNIQPHVIQFIEDARAYCNILIKAFEYEKEDFIGKMVTYLPRLYSQIMQIDTDLTGSSADDEYEYFQSYVDEDYYDSIRRNVETVLGPDDTFLETFEEDMKYSDTPIAASVSESLADIFQDLYNFVLIVKDSEGGNLSGALRQCKENFEAYWSQTLCNVMRPLNHLRFHAE